MLQASAPRQQVVGDVEHVVAVVVGQVDFQQAEIPVDGLCQPELAYQQLHRADAAGGRGPRAVGNFIQPPARISNTGIFLKVFLV